MTESESVALPLGDAAICILLFALVSCSRLGTYAILSHKFRFVNTFLKLFWKILAIFLHLAISITKSIIQIHIYTNSNNKHTQNTSQKRCHSRFIGKSFSVKIEFCKNIFSKSCIFFSKFDNLIIFQEMVRWKFMKKEEKILWKNRIDRYICQPVIGIPLFLLIIYI